MSSRLSRCIRSNREGQTLALVAVMMIALLAVMMIAIDLGMAYTARAEAQRVADAAALAGASAFRDHTNPFDAKEEAEERAKDYAVRNTVRNRPVKAEAPEVMVWVLWEEEKVRVRIQRDGIRTWFARLFGIDELTVAAIAAAQAMTAGGHGCVLPIAIPDRWYRPNGTDNHSGTAPMDEPWKFEEDDEYRPINAMRNETQATPETATSWGSKRWDDEFRDAGAQILLTPGHASGASHPGWYQYWKLPDAEYGCPTRGTNCLRENIKNCVDLGDLGIGDEIPEDHTLSESDAEVASGNRGKPIYDAFNDLVREDPDVTWNETGRYPERNGERVWEGESSRIVSVILTHPDDIMSGASHTLRIADIVTLFLETPGPNHHYPITGRLMHYGGGKLGGNEAGHLQKLLRLVE